MHVRAMTHTPWFFKLVSDLMGSSEPSIRLCAIRLQASLTPLTPQPSTLMGGTDAQQNMEVCTLFRAS